MDDRLSLGRRGEHLATEYLAGKGYAVLEKNVRTSHGELDLVASHEGVTVFVEIKTRRSIRFGWPEQAVSRQKQARLLAAAQAYLLTHPDLSDDWRIDVVAVQVDSKSSTPSFRHFEHALR